MPQTLRAYRSVVCRTGAFALAFLTAACSTLLPPSTPSPGYIPVLEAQRTASPSDPNTLTTLGMAYRRAGRLADARAVLEEAVAAAPDHPGAIYYLGLTAEDQEDFAEAERVYESFLETSASGGLRDDIADRLVRVRRLALLEEVRTSVAQEQALTGRPPTEGTVAVFPFLYSGSNDMYRPLSRALAELLAVDLNQVERITVLERLRVQALLDEIALTESGLVDPASGSRSGRLLGAERIVQGEIGALGENLSATALVVTTTTGVAGNQVRTEDEAERFMDMEKELVVAILESMGVVLTVAERERIDQNRTANLQALLAFGTGLEAIDLGNFDEARIQFDRASSLDPGFAPAQQRSQEARQGARASAVSIEQAAVRGGRELGSNPAVDEWLDLRFGFSEIETLAPTGPDRDPIPEVLGGETLGGMAGILRILFPRPGGGP